MTDGWYRYWAKGFHVKQDQDDNPPPKWGKALTIAVVNQKGGVGKTTTSITLSAALSELSLRVALVDGDPQGNATSGLGLRVGDDETTLYEVLCEDASLREALKSTDSGVLVLPTTIDLAGAEIELVNLYSREHRLKNALNEIKDDVDVVIIDCPPSLGLLTLNALTAADMVLIPVQAEYFALEGLGALQRNLQLVRQHLNPNLQTLGILLTMVDSRTNLSDAVEKDVRDNISDYVFESKIPRTVRFAEAPSFGMPITAFDSSGRGSMAYRRFAKEVLQRIDILRGKDE